MRAIVAVLLFVSAAHAALWGVLQEKQPAPNFSGILPSVSYAPFERGHTVADRDADSEKIRADLKKLSTLTRAVRLYSSTEGAELVPPIAAEFGLKVTVGAWIDTNADRNDREIKAAINLAREQQQRDRHRGRQRDHLSRRANSDREPLGLACHERKRSRRGGADSTRTARTDGSGRGGTDSPR